MGSDVHGHGNRQLIGSAAVAHIGTVLAYSEESRGFASRSCERDVDLRLLTQWTHD